ncbi:MAG: nitronate monooxygenase [Candidatus Dadabacteria bacterium]|nr:MAG: nitronate monooxygenase [Candidatus Dadabacteria bacterium]
MGAPLPPLAQRLGVRVPIIAAPMFIISNPAMIIAAGKAGMMGAMPSLNARTPEDFRAALEEIRRHLDGEPFAINIPLKLASPDRVQHDIEACLEFEVPVIITSLGGPAEVVRRAHEKNLLVFHDVISLKHGRKAVDAGVDAIIAVSSGAGGHAGTIAQQVLVPWLRRELKVPIIAAGGITGGRQLASVMALGAEMAYIGTRFIASTECAASDEYKEMVVKCSPEDIVYTDKVSGIHGNYIRHTVPGMAPEGEVKEGAKKWKDIWGAGQGVGLFDAVKPIAEIVEDIVREYRETVAALPEI